MAVWAQKLTEKLVGLSNSSGTKIDQKLLLEPKCVIRANVFAPKTDRKLSLTWNCRQQFVAAIFSTKISFFCNNQN